MKIAISVLGDISETDGTTVRAKRIFELLKAKFDVILIHRGNEDHKLSPVVTVKPPKTKLWNLKLIPIVLRSKFDCIYCCNDFYGFLTYFLLSKLQRNKIIFEAHSIMSEESKEQRHSRVRVKFSQCLEKFVMKRAHFIVTLSKNTFEFYQRYNSKIGLVPVFVNTDIFKIKGRPQRVDSKLIGLIGPFVTHEMRQMGSLEFLYARIRQFDSRIRFVVIGRCEERIENERIAYTGYLDSLEDYVNELSHLDAVLVPERTATFGPLNKIIEPMSCSLPVFTTPKGMVALYWVEPGRDILVFEENELVDKVNELIFNDKLMTDVGRNARLVVEQYYSKKANEEKLVRILESVGDD